MKFEMNFLRLINCSRTLRLHKGPVRFGSSIINRPVFEQRNELWGTKASTSHCWQYTHRALPSKNLYTCCSTSAWRTSRSYSRPTDCRPNNRKCLHLVETALTRRTFTSSCEKLFVQKWREFSSDATTFAGRGDVESIEEIEWTHPTTRAESVISQDPELHVRSLLCEIASDFGKSNEGEGASEEMIITDSEPSDSSTLNDACGKDDSEKGGSVAVMPEEDGFQKETETLSVTNIAEESMFVFDIDELVEILREENAQDICVIKVPPEKNYVDYFVVVTGRSTRHLSAMTQFINKVYKQRKHSSDPFLIMEGKLNDNWMCLDFGNIVVHFMLEETRSLYDLEQLWTLGREFDDHIQQWEQHEMLMFNPKTDLQMQERDDGEST